MKTKEIFKDIPGYENYQASNMGNVRSVDRTTITKNGQERFLKGRVLKGSINKGGYRYVELYINGEGRNLKVSQIIAMTYLSHTPDGHTKVVDHINGVKTDDRLSNLRIVSHRENTSTCFRKDRKTLSSKYVGVSWRKRDKRCQARILFEDKDINLGYYDDELEASKAYQDALVRIEDGTFNVNDYKPNFTSKFKGVYFDKAANRWRSQVRVNGKNKHIGTYPTELEAYQALQKFKKDNNKLIDKET